MSEVQQANFEGWAKIELMGHQVEIGFVKTEAYGQAVLFRVDTPDLPEREFTLTAPEWAEVDGVDGVRQWCPAGCVVKRAAVAPRTRLVSPNALYAINPCTEAAARTAIERSIHRPLILVTVPEGKLLSPRIDAEFDDDPEEDDDYDHEIDDMANSSRNIADGRANDKLETANAEPQAHPTALPEANK
jgi:hypothetical protein